MSQLNSSRIDVNLKHFYSPYTSMLFFRLPVSFLLLLLFLALIQSQAELGNRYIKLIEKKCINVENPALTRMLFENVALCEQAARSVAALDECVPASANVACSTATPTTQADCDLQSLGTCSGRGTKCSSIADGPESTCNATMDDTAGGATPCAWTSTNICTYTAAKFYSSMNQKDKPAGCLLYPGFEPGGATGKIIFNAYTSGDEVDCSEEYPCVCQEKCSNGKFQDQEGQSECKQCPKGQFQDQEGQSECKLCDAGKFNAQKEQKSSRDGK